MSDPPSDDIERLRAQIAAARRALQSFDNNYEQTLASRVDGERIRRGLRFSRPFLGRKKWDQAMSGIRNQAAYELKQERKELSSRVARANEELQASPVFRQQQSEKDKARARAKGTSAGSPITDPTWRKWEETRSQRASKPPSSSPIKKLKYLPNGKPWPNIIEERVNDIKKWWQDLDEDSGGSRSEIVRRATELYLLFQDGGDMDMPVDPKVRERYTALARKHPACSIEEEAIAWLKMDLMQMSEIEIRQAVQDAVLRMPTRHRFSSAHDDNINDFIAYKTRNER